MDTKQTFFNTIHEYYIDMSDNKVPSELVKELSEVVTDYYYEQYNRFARQYPKSAKRYSSFDLKELDHPTTFEMVIKYFKNKLGDNYRAPSRQILKMNDEQLVRFEKNREDFHNMW